MFFPGKNMGIKLVFWFKKNRNIKGENKRMNSFKKIALGLVAAMTLGTIVATPASANSVTLGVTTANSGTGAAADPYVIKVPADNSVNTSTSGSSEFLTVQATVPTGTTTTFTAVGNAKIISATGATVNASAGVTTLTVTPAAETATVYVYTTSTAASAVTVSVTGASRTIYLKGEAGLAYNVALSVPTSGNIGGFVTATATVTDVFGNAVATAPTITAINAVSVGTVDTTTATGVYTARVNLPVTAGTTAVGASINASAIATLAAPVTSASSLVSVLDLASALAAEKAARAADKVTADAALAAALAKAASDSATAKAVADAAAITAAAEIAKLKADAVTAKVAADKALADAQAAAKAELDKVKADNAKAIADLKAAFNKLARQWNKSNPKSRVALVK